MKFCDGGYLIESEAMRMNVSPQSNERRSLLPVEAALALMISFGSLIVTLIFGILGVVKNYKKSNRRIFASMTVT